MSGNRQGQGKPRFWQKIVLVLFGLIVTVIILETGLRLGGFILLSLQEYKNRLALKQKGAYRIMCLGESTTADSVKINSYPRLLDHILNQRNVGITFSVINKGVIGTNTLNILNNLESNLDEYRPDLVVVMMGVNEDLDYIRRPQGLQSDKWAGFIKSFRIYNLFYFLRLHLFPQARSSPLSTGIYKDWNSSGIINQHDQKAQSGHEASQLSVYENPKDEPVVISKEGEYYRQIGDSYWHSGDISKASQSYSKALESDPQNFQLYWSLGMTYRKLGKLPEAETVFKKAIEFSPNNPEAYYNLGEIYIENQDIIKAVACLNKAIEVNPAHPRGYLIMAWVYLQQKKFSEAEAILRKAVTVNPNNDYLWGGLAAVYSQKGQSQLSEECYKKALEIRMTRYNPNTRDNYLKLYQILKKRKILLVCMQYAMRNVNSLKNLFGDEAKDIVFVDNELTFKKAVAKDGYDKYFVDIFGGDFGHCTEEGNRLLAENVARVILKEVFGK